MINLKKILLASLLFTIPLLSNAASNSILEQQRATFQQAQNALNKHDYNQYNRLKHQLGDYPLQDYLEYRFLRLKLSQLKPDTLEQFLHTNKDDVFYTAHLRNYWLDHLAQKQQWALYLQQYQTPQIPARQCTRLKALIMTGQHRQALSDIPEMWLVGKSQHQNCDYAFQYWENQGKLTNKLRWQRLELALQNQQFSLANYLAKSVKETTAAQQLVGRWQQMLKNPLGQLRLLPVNSQANPQFQKLDIDAMEKALVQYGLSRLSRKSTDQAFYQWQRLASHYHFSRQQEHDISANIANRAALNRQDNTLTFFGDLPNEHWRVRAALWQQDWPAVKQAIKSLSLAEQSTTRWQYWLARSHAAQGNQRAADTIYHKLMLERDYYGFLAADKLGKQYQMNHQSLAFKPSQLDQFAKRRDIAHLYEFYIQNMATSAHRQAYHLRQTLPKNELEMLAKLTHQWGWHNQTIALLGKAESWNDLNLRFPVVYEQKMIHAGRTTKLDPSWLLGVARQESAFNPSARSPVGARGLMQLMPETGKSIARQIKQPLKDLAELVNPGRNIQLGSAYLRHVYDTNQQNPVLATASYNAGPHRIAHWLPKQKLPADIWIENIPFNETRKYTGNVISYAAIFDFQRQRKITPLSERMPAIQPKKP